MIAITDNLELNRFGFTGDKFRRLTRDRIGGWEWGGPCPSCGGDDRFIVSNGYFWCRQCGRKGSLERIGGIKPDPESRRQAKIAAQKAEKERQEEQRVKLVNLNKSRVWEIFHQNLINNDQMILHLQKEGISLRSIEKYQLGYHPKFSAYRPDTSMFVYVPSVAFPHFNGGRCLNIRMRILDKEFTAAHAKYLPYRSGLPTMFFRAFEPEDREVLIVEGEKKAIVLQEIGIPAIGLWGIHALKDKWIPWFKKRFDKRYLLFDADNWGVIQSSYRQAEKIDAKTIFLDKPGKVDDLILKGNITGHDIRAKFL